MIPKIIHYCWFGGAKLPELAQKCIASWEKFCPDYEICRWDESNYDVNKCKYMAEAYKEHKWGFVPDYARFEIIYEYGGFYLDTDVEIIKPFDELLEKKGIMGFESAEFVAGGLIIAGEKENSIFKEMCSLYEKLSFYKEDGSLNLVPSPFYNTEVLKQHGLDVSKSNEIQNVGGITVYPPDYFCPKNYETGFLNITENTYTIHHYDGSWLSETAKEFFAARFFLYERFPRRIAKILVFFPFCRRMLKELGIIGFMKKTFQRVLKIRRNTK